MVEPIPQKEEDQAAPYESPTSRNTSFGARAHVEEDDPVQKSKISTWLQGCYLNNLNTETTPTKHQNENQFPDSQYPINDVPDGQPGNREQQSHQSNPHELRRENSSPLQGSSQNEAESTPDEKIRRLSEAIETGQGIRSYFDEGSGRYDIFARGTSGNEGQISDDEVEQSLPVAVPTISDRHTQSPLQGSSQKEKQSPADEKVHRLSLAIERGDDIRYCFNRESGDCEVFVRRTPNNDGREPNREVRQSPAVTPTNSSQHMLPSLRDSSPKEKISPASEKIDRLLEAVRTGNEIRFRLSDDSDRYDVFARTSCEDGRLSDGEVEQRLPVTPLNSVECVLPPLQDSSRQKRISPSASSRKENTTPEERTDQILNAIEAGYQTFLRPSGPNGGLDPVARTSGDDGRVRDDDIGLAERNIEADQGWSNDESIRGPPRNRSPLSSVEEIRSDRLAVMGPDRQIRFFTISPVPFAIHKVPLMQTPSVYSDDAELEKESPSYSHSLINGGFLLTEIERPKARKTSLSHEYPQDVETWLDHIKKSPPDVHQEKPRTFGSWPHLGFDSAFPPDGQDGPDLDVEISEVFNQTSPSPAGRRNEIPENFKSWQYFGFENAFPSDGQEETDLKTGILGDSKPGSSSPSGGQEKTAVPFEIWEDIQLGDPSPSGKQKGTGEGFENWGKNEPGNLTPTDQQKKPAGSLKIWGDIELEKLAPSGKRKDVARSFKVWNDAEHGYPSTSQSAPALPHSALHNVTNLRHAQYLMEADSVRASTVARDMKSNIDPKRVASLRGAKKLPNSRPSRLQDIPESREFAQADDRVKAINRASPLSAAQDHIIDYHSCPPNSPASSVACSNSKSSGDGSRTPVPHHRRPLHEFESCSPNWRSIASIATDRVTTAGGQGRQKHGLERVESFAFTQARLEGSMSPKPASPIQRFAHLTGVYDDDVYVEHGAYFGHPVPRRWINPGVLLERFHRTAEIVSFDRDHSGMTSDQ